MKLSHFNVILNFFFFPQLGPSGYAFAINNNGYIVFHPGLKAQVGSWKSVYVGIVSIVVNINYEDES